MMQRDLARLQAAHRDHRRGKRVLFADFRIAGEVLLKYCLDIIAPQSEWNVRFVNLLNEYPDIPKEKMGFPVGWEKCPIWMKRFTGGAASAVVRR